MSALVYRRCYRVTLAVRNFSQISSGSDLDFVDNDPTMKMDNQYQQQVYRDIMESLTKRWRLPDSRHSVLVIQPDFKYKMKKNFLTTVKYQMEESVSLVETLPNWKVVDKVVCSIKYQKSTFFGPGQLSMLVRRVHQPTNVLPTANTKVSAVFISVNMLTSSQLTRLRRLFQCDVYDRYALVLEIFRRHAHSAESRLQVALAEVPYVRARIGEIIRSKSLDQLGGGLTSVCGPGETLSEQLKRFLHHRESHIMTQLKKVEEQRATLRSARKLRELPSVAVVGYTNAGKTSLTRILSGDASRLIPNSRLFATLDVTSHGARLPCGLRVIFLDTVGFLSDLPTQLVAAFKSTLEDVRLADLVIHVIDLSNPDWPNQRQEVHRTLEELQLPEILVKSMLEVGNKADTFSCDHASVSALLGTSTHCISTRTGAGVANLVEAIEKGVLANTGRRIVRMRIPTAGPHFAWLHREQALVQTCGVSDDGESMIVDALFTESSLSRFRAKFGSPGQRKQSSDDSD